MTIFEKIIAREIPAEIVHEDEVCIAFRDIAPKAPQHILIVPKHRVERLATLRAADTQLVGHLLVTASTIATKLGFGASGFRVVINSGPDGGETVPHLHVHLLAGRQLGWPPG